MSTRGNICIKLKEEDLDKTLPLYNEENRVIGTIRTRKETPYMYVYCHHDSYEENPGLGYRLPRNLKSYEEVKRFILHGDRTSFDEPYTSYNNESIEDNMPQFAANVDGQIPEEYFYLFEDNHWKVKSWSEADARKPFRDIEYEAPEIKITEQELEAIEWLINKFNSVWNAMHDIDETHYSVVMLRLRELEKKIKSSK